MTDPFDLEEDPLKRDRWDRPLLVPVGGGERQPYTRASTLSNYLTDSGGLHTWDLRNVAIGMGIREDACALAASLPPINAAKRGKKTLTAAEKKQDRETNKALDEIIASAKEAAYGLHKARMGTAIHAFCEPGADVDLAPTAIRPDIYSFHAKLAALGIRVVASELFVANDELQAAGSFDYIAWVPGLGFVIIDIKTGQVDGKGLSFAVQMSTYATAVLYNPVTDERTPLESLTGGEAINTDVALLAHVPLGEGRTDLYAIDIKTGLHCAVKATHVRAARRLDLMSAWSPMTSAMSA